MTSLTLQVSRQVRLLKLFFERFQGADCLLTIDLRCRFGEAIVGLSIWVGCSAHSKDKACFSFGASSGSATSTSIAATMSSPAIEIKTDGGSSSVEILTNMEELVSPFKCSRLVRLGVVDFSMRMHIDEPVFRIVDITKPS